ncbi:MAG: mechanosensitive ion channel [Prevotellaceae bacterium]|nr:mechanosensitive ion channel [Prevotellaceae bacterium]
MSWVQVEELINKGIEIGVTAVSKLLLALLIWWIGSWLIRRARKLIKLLLEKRQVEPSLRSFLLSLINVVMIIMLVLIVVGTIGIDTSSFLALIATAGFGLGMALSGTLQNFAGGVMIMLFRPYRVGDFIETQGQSGTVTEIRIFSTILNTPDNKVIHIPNGPLSSSVVYNYSKEPLRRVNWDFTIAQGDDYDKAKAHILSLMAQDSRILDTPAAPFVAINKVADGVVELTVRSWVNSADYWDVYFSINEKVYKTFASVGLRIPLPQLEVTAKP